MKRDYTLYIYKQDRRYKVGERLFSTTVWTGTDDNGMRRTVADLFETYRPEDGFRFDWAPATKVVKNLMTGEMIEIAADTPHCADPSTERYWSM